MNKFGIRVVTGVLLLTLPCLTEAPFDLTKGNGLEYHKALDISGWCEDIEGARFGDSLAMGDVNGDGFADVIVAAPYDAVRVYPGSFQGLDSSPMAIIYADCEDVVTADINGDRLDDIIVGGPRCVYAYHGDSAWTGDSGTLELYAYDADWSQCLAWGSGFGKSVAMVGDLNVDGIDDIGVTANSEVHIYYGSPSGLPEDHIPDFMWGPTTIQREGHDYHITGYVMIDKCSQVTHLTLGKIDQFMVSTTGWWDADDNGYQSPSESMSAVVTMPHLWVLTGDYDTELWSYQFGEALSNAGDVNGDGYDDVIVSDKGLAPSHQPKVFVYLGNNGALPVVMDDYAWSVEGIAGVTSAQLGSAVGCAGDINGDGYADIIIGDPLHDARPDLPPDHLGYWGRIYIFFGGPSTAQDPSGLGQNQTPLDADIIIDGGPISGMFGYSSAAGDINNDGRSDLAVGVPRGAGVCYLDGGSDFVETGLVYVYLAKCGSKYFKNSGSWTGAGHGTDGWYAGDFNGDRKDDIFRYVPGVSGAEVFLSDGVKFSNAGSWTGAGHGTDGWYVGDFNGDGKDDIFRYISGVSGAQVFLSDGTKFVYSGSWTGAGHGTDGWYLGDFNGDGKEDIFRYVPGVSGAQVFLSDGTKFVFSGSWTGAGHGTDGWYVGDFNGDGKDDIFRYVSGISGAEVFLSDGTKFVNVGSWTGAGHGTDGWYVGDFNGDNRDDIFRYVSGVSGAQVFLSDGTKFNSSGSWTGAGHGTDGWYVGNFDGIDGKDIFRYRAGFSGAEVFLSSCSFVPASSSLPEVNALAFDEDMMLDVYGARQTEMSFQEETALLTPFMTRMITGEEVSIYEIKAAYEQRVVRVVRLVEIRQLLQRHGYWDIEE
jgi:hypothetical protein